MNEYGKELCFEASNSCMKAYKILKDIDHNICFVEGTDFEYKVLETAKELLMTLHQEYYQKAMEGES
jgi:hypothetical protein